MKTICYACGELAYPQRRYYNHDSEGNVLCRKCCFRYCYSPKNSMWGLRWNKWVNLYGLENVSITSNPRKGICKKCGNIKGIDCKKTDIHHEKYEQSDILASTVELCPKCHGKLSVKNTNIPGFTMLQAFDILLTKMRA